MYGFLASFVMLSDLGGAPIAQPAIVQIAYYDDDCGPHCRERRREAERERERERHQRGS